MRMSYILAVVHADSTDDVPTKYVVQSRLGGQYAHRFHEQEFISHCHSIAIEASRSSVQSGSDIHRLL
jgi:hypothetical protein